MAVRLAQSLLELDRPEEAAAVAKKLVDKKAPRHAGATQLARALAKLGRQDEAEAVLSACMGEQSSAALWAALADLRTERGALSEALDAIDHAITLEPGVPWHLLKKARILLAAGEILPADRTSAELAQKFPDFAAAADLARQMASHKLAAARDLVEQGGRDSAEKALSLLASVEVDALTPGGAATLARAHDQLGNTDAARAALLNAIERHPDNAYLRSLLGRQYLNARDFKAALKTLVPLEEQAQANIVNMLVQARAELDGPAAAAGTFERALTREPENADYICGCARFRNLAGEPKAAVTVMEKLKGDLSASQALILARSHMLLNNPRNAARVLRPTLAANANDSRLRLSTVAALLAAGDLAEAITTLDGEKGEKSVLWYRNYLTALDRQGHLDAVQVKLAEALAKWPQDGELAIHLLAVRARQGQPLDANIDQDAIVAAIRSDPSVVMRNAALLTVHADSKLVSTLLGAAIDAMESNPAGAKPAEIVLLTDSALKLPAEAANALLKRLVPLLESHEKGLSTEQRLIAASACLQTKNSSRARRYLAEIVRSAERPSDIIETLGLAASLNDAQSVRTLVSRLQQSRGPRDGEAVSLIPGGRKVRIFLDATLGASGFETGSKTVALQFPGVGNPNSRYQQDLTTGLVERGVTVVRLHDFQRDAFLGGIGAQPTGMRASAKALARLVSDRGYETVISFGISAGGLAAMLYGLEIGAHHIVAFSPFTYMPPVTDAREPRGRAFRAKVGPLLGLHTDAAKQIAARKKDGKGHLPSFKIYYPATSKPDVYHVERIKDLTDISLHPVDSGEHIFVQSWSVDELTEAVIGGLPLDER